MKHINAKVLEKNLGRMMQSNVSSAISVAIGWKRRKGPSRWSASAETNFV
jgi:hypothetical protein